MLRLALAVLAITALPGCGLFGPSCLARQERGPVTTLTGTLAPGERASHVVLYDARGSQNNVEVSWGDRFTAGGPRLIVYATRAGCTQLATPPQDGSGECAILGRAGTLSDGNVASTLVVTHGRGNPERLGTPPRFKLWVQGDPEQPVHYTLIVTYFYGPDC